MQTYDVVRCSLSSKKFKAISIPWWCCWWLMHRVIAADMRALSSLIDLFAESIEVLNDAMHRCASNHWYCCRVLSLSRGIQFACWHIDSLSTLLKWTDKGYDLSHNAQRTSVLDSCQLAHVCFRACDSLQHDICDDVTLATYAFLAMIASLLTPLPIKRDCACRCTSSSCKDQRLCVFGIVILFAI